VNYYDITDHITTFALSSPKEPNTTDHAVRSSLPCSQRIGPTSVQS